MGTPLMRALGLIGGLLLSAGAEAIAAPDVPSAAKVSFLEGQAARLDASGARGLPGPDAPWKPLKVGAMVREGDALRTARDARLELTLPDGSRLRLGPETQVLLAAGRFAGGGEGDRQVSLRLWLGRVWAKVAKRAGGESRFEVETDNAVAGVRGTSFAVVARSDLSALVKVYAGAVGVKKSSPVAGARRQIAGPSRVDQRQWEELVAGQMKQVRISSAGELSPVEDLVDAGDEALWAAWNQARDRAP
jgi:hypothetical protein